MTGYFWEQYTTDEGHEAHALYYQPRPTAPKTGPICHVICKEGKYFDSEGWALLADPVLEHAKHAAMVRQRGLAKIQHDHLDRAIGAHDA